MCLPSELFDNYMQQDAHEFLNYLLNTIADLLQEEKSQERQQNGKLVQNGGGGGSEGGGGGRGGDGDGGKETQQTWVHEIFQGTLTNETRCLNCEAVGSHKNFLELCHTKAPVVQCGEETSYHLAPNSFLSDGVQQRCSSMGSCRDSAGCVTSQVVSNVFKVMLD